MATLTSLVQHLDDVLVAIDARLATGGVPLTDRPFMVALTLLQERIVEVSTDYGATCYELDGSADFAVTPWFSKLYKGLEDWYRDRFGAAFDVRSDKAIRAVVLIRGTPFALRVPTSRVRPEDPGKTIWLSFPDHVEADDVVTDWVVNPPNLQRWEADTRALLESDIREIAGALRFIRTNLMGVAGGDDALAGFRHGVVAHLERAAELIIATDGDSAQKAWWELQMTMESALKGLLLQKNGSFPFTHRLNELFDAAESAGLAFDVGRFDVWPAQAEMMQLRYAQGTRRDVASVFDAYRLTLAAASAAVGTMRRMRLGQARFLLQQPPWMRDHPADPHPDAN